MLKAAKEAKVNTSWINPNEAYDEALQAFVARTLEPSAGNRFLREFAAFQAPVARLGMVNSLAQTLVKITAPGVPDFYRGTEVWDFSLVDPDSRRPVDFGARAALLEGLRARLAAGDQAGLARELVERWTDGRIKLYTIYRALTLRRSAPDLFLSGDYLPLQVSGPGADHVCAFARRHQDRALLTLVPRLTARLTQNGARLPLGHEVWGGTRAALPPGFPHGPYTNRFTGATVGAAPGGGGLEVGEILAEFPVALLEGPAQLHGADGEAGLAGEE
jgi:(1->4)-alpha-D-glucan 1-alpha-D-glucosylmutase